MKNSIIYYLLILVVFISACEEMNTNKLFEIMDSANSGITFSNDLVDTDAQNIIEYLYYFNGGGVAIEDVNNDLLPDIYFTSNQGDNQLYLNRGGFQFDDITSTAFPAYQDEWTTGVTMADVNNDGWVDIYTSVIGSDDAHNRLWINNQDSTFTDQSRAVGLDLKVMGTQAAFFDYDLDGDLDMYMLCHSLKDSEVFRDTAIRRAVDTIFGDRLMKSLLTETGQLAYEDVTLESGIYSSAVGFGLGINTSDINQDGWPDIYVGNDFHENDYIYINNQDGTFKESAAALLPHGSTFSMGNDIADINNDGLVDIMTLDMKPSDREVFQNSTGIDAYDTYRFKLGFGYEPQYSQNCLFLNQGDQFSDVSNAAGVPATDWSWSVLMEDFDMDGWKDIFISNGILRRPNDQYYLNFLSNDAAGAGRDELVDAMPEGQWRNYFYRNNQDATFIDETASWSDMQPDLSTGAAVADLDLDGDLDVVVNRINESALVLKNNSPSSNYLIVDVSPDLRNAFLGALISVRTNSFTLHDHVASNRGFQSSSEPIAHFGLGDHEGEVEVSIVWPDGTEQVLENVAINERLYISRKEGAPKINNLTVLEPQVLDIRHQENNFTDLNNQKLMPFSLASSGPAIAVGDINGDGEMDIFLGNGSGFADEVYAKRSAGYELIQSLDNPNETVDATFVDIDNDDDLDLITISGGNESITVVQQSIAVYLNDGSGNFELINIPLPYSNSNHSCIRPSDIDADGDMDIFIGKQYQKNQYGLIDKSIILVNDGTGHFPKSDILTIDLGMVHDAKWVDINEDGQDDLVVASAWREIQILYNKVGTFNHTIIPNSSGLWRSIAVDDVDGDGVMDIVAGNVGTNTPLKASKEFPLTMYVSDFMQSGFTQPIICQYDKGKLYTYENRDNLSSPIPWIRKKYPNYKAFAKATARDIFELALDGIPTFEVDHLESKIFKGLGAGGFSPINLPIEAQYASIEAIKIVEKEDGDKSIMTGGNLYEMTPSLGRLDGSYMNLFELDQNNKWINVRNRIPVIDGQVRTIKGIGNNLLIGLNDDTVKSISY